QNRCGVNPRRQMTDRDELARLLWERTTIPRRGPRPTLTTTAIANAGIEIADTNGLAAVTMPQGAETLGVTKMALYRYLPGKAELIGLMTDAAIGQPPTAHPELVGWRARLDFWSRRMFEVFHRHPWVLETAVGNRLMGPNEIAWIETLVTALADSGLDGGEQLDVAATLAGHVRSLVQQELSTDHTAAESTESTLAGIIEEHANRFPALATALGSASAPPNRAFDFGLARILDGVESLITR